MNLLTLENVSKQFSERLLLDYSPAAAISHATTDLQRVVRSTVSGLPQAMAEADIAAPAVLVFGEVAALHDQLDWFIPGGSAAGFVPLAEE